MKKIWKVVAVDPQTEKFVASRKCTNENLAEMVTELAEKYDECDICCFGQMRKE